MILTGVRWMQVHFTTVNVGRKFRDSSWCPPEIHVLLIGGLPNFVIDNKLLHYIVKVWIWGSSGLGLDNVMTEFIIKNMSDMKNRHQFLFYNKLLPYWCINSCQSTLLVYWQLTIIIIHWTHCLFSDSMKVYSEYSKSAPLSTSACKLYNN